MAQCYIKISSITQPNYFSHDNDKNRYGYLPREQGSVTIHVPFAGEGALAQCHIKISSITQPNYFSHDNDKNRYGYLLRKQDSVTIHVPFADEGALAQCHIKLALLPNQIIFLITITRIGMDTSPANRVQLLFMFLSRARELWLNAIF
ncbi:hypothetical protein [Legionella shakespearei]|uniref:Uncharacterized protein n=1 Tax=Legionella shakespearei DSM 23087 TaxID=1122169 RepID=A0A0W0YJX3_9GAMM|nr:hypothetical protein [Legionella shakespearei]KTD57213.1 hypothetical protein Lsha_2595 [Legionella shakespearei DSM 23087]